MADEKPTDAVEPSERKSPLVVERPPATIKAEVDVPKTMTIRRKAGAPVVTQVRDVKLEDGKDEFTLDRADALTVLRYEPAAFAEVVPLGTKPEAAKKRKE